MARLISLLAAVALIAAPLATAGDAMARGHDGGGAPEHRGGRGEAHGEFGGRWTGGDRGRGPAMPAPYRGGEYRGGGGEYRRGGYEQAEPRAYGREPRMDPRYDPRGYGAPPPGAYSAAPRRGGFLGPGYGGEVIQDYGRFRLRPPPRGYEWVRTAGGMALMSQATGQVFDIVPY